MLNLANTRTESEIKPEPEIKPKEIEKEKNKHRVIAFKLSKQVIEFIHDVVHERKTYASLSELVRIAVMDLIDHCIEIKYEEITDFELSDNVNQMKKDYQDAYKESACSKFPRHLLEVTDKIIKDFEYLFINRTNFIRTAVYMLQMKEDKIYNYWLRK